MCRPQEEPKAEIPAAARSEGVDNWEERADEAAPEPSSASGSDRKIYSRDFLINIGCRILTPLLPALDAYHSANIGLDKPQDNTRIGSGMGLARAGSRDGDWGARGGGRGGDFGRADAARGGQGDRRGDRGGPPGRAGSGQMDRRGSGECVGRGWRRADRSQGW